MKKETKILISLIAAVFLLILVLAFVFNFVKAQEPAMPTLPGGITPEKIEEIGQKIQTPEEAANETKEYLKREWAKIIAKHPVINKIHIFFKEHPLVFTILFNIEYEISWKFICIVLLWFYIMAITADIVSGLTKGFLSIVIGIGMAIILAQVGAISGLVGFILNLLFAQKLWWVRLILGVVIILILTLAFYLFDIISKYLQEAKKKARERAIEVTQRVMQKFIKKVETE